MDSAEQQVIDALAARLVPMAATAGRVYTDRTWPLDGAALPAWKLELADVQSRPYTTDGVDRREVLIDARVYARAVSDLPAALQALSAAGQALLFAAPRPWGLQLDGAPQRLPGPEGEAAAGSLQLRLRALVFVRAAQPGTILN